MFRRNRIFIWLTGIVALLGLTYAVSPLIVAGLIRHNLSAWGLRDVQVSVGYPDWRSLRVHQLRFNTIAGAYEFSCQATDVDVEYRLAALLAGTVARIRVPVVEVRVGQTTGIARPVRTIAAVPLAALLSGQWLSQLPMRELSLEQVNIDARTASNAIYTINLRGNIGEDGAQVSGIAVLPKPQQNQLALSFTARKTGEVRLSVSPSTNVARPVLELTVDKVANNRDPIEVSGRLHAKLQALASALKPWLTGMDWVSGFEGQFDTRWQALLPAAASEDTIRLTLQQLHGKGSNWDVAGEASVHGIGGRQREQPLSLKLVKLDGHYKKMALVGLNAEAALAIGDGLHTTKDAQLNVDLLEVGFPIKNIVARFRLAQQTRTKALIVQVQKVGAELLGGKARSGPFELGLGKGQSRFVAQLEGIGLNDIMQLERQEGLQGSGILDGRIPVTITRHGIQVAQGRLTARAPGGDIRYLPTGRVLSLAQSNPNMKMVVDALSNFQYHKLEVTSDYKPDGNLALQVRLEGKNPDWQAGQPVNLNLNLEENIPALLRSLQLSSEITERVRKYYKAIH
jgi:hypothetical protein